MFLAGGSTDVILMFYSLNMKTFKGMCIQIMFTLSFSVDDSGSLLEHCESSFSLDSISVKYSSNNSNSNRNDDKNRNNYKKNIFSKLNE